MIYISIRDFYKRMKLKGETIALAMAFFYALTYTPAYADNAAGSLGVCNIENPAYDEANGNNNPHPSAYNRVYFGFIPATTTGMAKSGSSCLQRVPYGDACY